MKQTFNIPEGCKVVTVEQIGNQLITSFEPEKYLPKKGDCVKRISEHGNIYIGEYDGDRELYHCVDVKANVIRQKMIMLVKQGYFHKITPEELQSEFEKLGYVYNFETHTASKKRWRAKHNKSYYFVSCSFEVKSSREDGHSIDDKRHEKGNYFETKEDCQKYCDYLKECSLKYFDK